MGLIRMDPLKNAGRSAMGAGILMFGGFITYYSFLFYWGFSRLSDLIVMFWSAIPYLADPSDLRVLLFLFTSDFPAISFALNFTLTGSSILIYLPLFCAIMVFVFGLFIWKKKGNIKLFGWLLISFIVLAFLSFSLTFVVIFPIILLGVFLLLCISVFSVLYSCWILLWPSSKKEKVVKKEDYISVEEYWRRTRIPDEVVYASVIIFIASFVVLLIWAVWSVQQLKNSEYINNILGILESML